MYQTYTSYSINIPKIKFLLHLEINVLCNYQIKQKLENYLFIFLLLKLTEIISVFC